ncbi:MAG: hypothetical protein ACR2FY_02200 [Pirellulaceae bacterium]
MRRACHLLGVATFVFAVMAAGTLRGEEYKGATITKIDDKLGMSLEIGSKRVVVTAFPFMKGFGTDGKELKDIGHGLRVLKVGNVVDIKTEVMKLRGKPETFISEARLIKGELQSLEVLRSQAGKKPAKGDSQPLPQYTVVKADRTGPVVLRGEDGKEIEAKPSLAKAFDDQGEPLPSDQFSRVLKAGNVLEVELTLSNKRHVIKTARLVHGELTGATPKFPSAGEPAAELTRYRGAVLKTFGLRGQIIVVGDKEIALGGWTPTSEFFDDKGQNVKGGQALIAAFKPGSTVDVTLLPPPKNGDGKPRIQEMRLVEGK